MKKRFSIFARFFKLLNRRKPKGKPDPRFAPGEQGRQLAEAIQKAGPHMSRSERRMWAKIARREGWV